MFAHKNDSFNPKRRSFNSQVCNAIRKYGWDNIIKEIILICKKSQIDNLEREYIEIFNCTNRIIGYNRESGGSKNKIMSTATRKLMAQNRIGKPQWGKKVLQIDPRTNQVIKEWKSMSEASRELKISKSNIGAVCNKAIRKCKIKGKEYFSVQKRVGGFNWSFPNKILTNA